MKGSDNSNPCHLVEKIQYKRSSPKTQAVLSVWQYLKWFSTHSSIKFFARTLDRCNCSPLPQYTFKSIVFCLNESDLTFYVGILLRHMPSALRIVLIDLFLESNRFEENAMNPLPRQKFYAKKFDDDDFVVGHLSWKIWVPVGGYNFVSFNRL